MKENYHSEFEDYLRENVDNYRMYPSDQVWDGVNNRLHKKPWRYGLVLSILLISIGSLVAYIMISSSTTAKPEAIAQHTNKQSITAEPDRKNSTLLIAVPKQSANADYKTTSQQLIADIKNTKSKTANQSKTSIDEVEAISSMATNTEAPSANNAPAAVSILKQSVATEKKIVLGKMLPVVDIKNPVQIPASIISAPIKTNALAAISKPAKKLIWQIHASPTISYRRLADNKEFLIHAANNGNITSTDIYKDVKKIVIHKPSIGLELGLTAKLPVSSILSLKGGLQFNITRYDIRAYRNYSEFAIITLNEGGSTNYSISTLSQYRTQSGGRINWLENLYYSAALPIGAEIILSAKKNRYWSLSGTIQPTVLLNNRSYMLSTDFKNYVEEPSLLRRVNLNAGIEVLYTIKGSKRTWQIGPQARYQLSSSFVNKYPVKENLFDFGIKMGVNLTKP